MMHQHVMIVQGAEDAHVVRQRGLGRHKRGVLQVPHVQVGDRRQAGQVEQARHPVDGAVIDVELGHQPLQDVLGDRLLDLEPDRRLEPAPHQLALERLEQVLGDVLVDLQVADPRDPEYVVLEDVQARRTAGQGARR